MGVTIAEAQTDFNGHTNRDTKCLHAAGPPGPGPTDRSVSHKRDSDLGGLNDTSKYHYTTETTY